MMAHSGYKAPGPAPRFPASRLEKLADAYDDGVGLVRLPAYGMGYFTRFKGGELVHPTRESMEYATLLAFQGAGGAERRLERIVNAVLDLQELNPSSGYFGVWPWFSEESLDRMQGVDRNWADFIGAFLVDLLAFQRERFQDATVRRMVRALEAACKAIGKRGVGPGYTNICAMDAAVTCAAGEILGESSFHDYGRRSLTLLYRRCSGFLVFDEYNSPAYTPILIEELDRLLRLVNDRRCRRMAEAIRGWAWEGIACHYHPGLQAWVGAQSRTYLDRMGSRQRAFIEEKVGIEDKTPTSPQPCPESVRTRFHRPVIRNCHQVYETPGGKSLSLWETPHCALGSVDHEQMWVQCRPLIGTFKTPEGEIAVFRMRVLLNGRDYAGATLTSIQKGPRILAALSLSPAHGVWHPHIDRPKDGVLSVDDLRIRFEVSGVETAETRLPAPEIPGAIDVDGRGVRLFPTDSWLGRPLRWETGRDDTSSESHDGDNDNWFPTDGRQGGGTPSSTWIDAVVSLEEGNAIRVDEWTKPTFAIGLELGEWNRLSAERLGTGPDINCRNEVISWQPDAGGASFELRLQGRTNGGGALRSWKDPYWCAHPLEFSATLLYRISCRSETAAAGIAGLRRVSRWIRSRF